MDNFEFEKKINYQSKWKQQGLRELLGHERCFATSSDHY
jgi:hypothetical protein